MRPTEIAVAFVLTLSCTVRASAQQPPKLSVILKVSADDEDLRNAIRSSLASELRQLGDVTVVDDPTRAPLATDLEAVAVGTVDHYAMCVRPSAESFVGVMNSLMAVAVTKNEKGCIDAAPLKKYLTDIAQVIGEDQTFLYHGAGRESLRRNCANAVAAADNGLLKVVRQQVGMER